MFILSPPFLIIGVLVRIDFVVYALAVFGYLFFDTKTRRKAAFGLSSFVLAMFIYTGFRYMYYGEILPNTYYLKATGYPVLYRVMSGFYALSWFSSFLPAVVILIGAFVARKREVTLLCIIVFLQILYSVYVGGDAWEYFGGSNRYISVVMPLFFVLLFSCFFYLYSLFQKQLKDFLWLKIISIVILIVTFLSLNGQSDKIVPRLLFLSEPFERETNVLHVEHAQAISAVTAPDAKVAVTSAGVVSYFSDERLFIDMLGKNDEVIAKQKAHFRSKSDRKIDLVTSFRPGHVKWDYDYSIGKRKPDVIVSFQTPTPENVLEYLESSYEFVYFRDVGFYVRKDSEYVKWNLLNSHSSQSLSL